MKIVTKLFGACALVAALFAAAPALANTGTIDATNHYAWSDNGGYVNWAATGGNVTVTDTALTGYIWSAGFGWISLAPDQGGVTNSGGTLGGYAWGANTGWINFAGVTIDSNGRFHGSTVAQSLFGTMTFDCSYCNVTTTWHNSTVSTGGGGTISGSQSYGYQNGDTSAATPSGNSSNANPPKSLTPSNSPPSTQPTSGPSNSATVPAHLTPSITLSIYTAPTAVIGSPLALNITFSDTKRTQNITYAYRLYRADSSIAYSNTGILAPTSTPSFTVSIPTAGLAAGTYKVAVSAQYGNQSVASQTLSIGLYTTKAEASSQISGTGVPTAQSAASCSWLTCWWLGLLNFFKGLF